MARPIRVGIIGGGFMGRVHTAAAKTNGAEIVGIASSSLESAKRAADQFGINQAFGSAEELLASPDIDLVHITTPNSSHAELALAAIKAGKHQICEKPLAMSYEQAVEVTEAAEKSGLVATVPFIYRYHALAREARARVANGTTGRVYSVRGSYLQDWLLEAGDDNWRVSAAAGGSSRAFADIGSHLVDLMEFIIGDRIVELNAVTNTVHAERGGHKVETEDEASVLFKTKGGAIGNLFVSQVAPGRKNRLLLDIAGAKESIEFNQEQPETIWVGRRTGSLLLPRDESQNSADANRLSIVPGGHPQGYVDAFAGFVRDTYDAVSGGNPDGLPRFSDGLRASKVTSAVLASAKSGNWVQL